VDLSVLGFLGHSEAHDKPLPGPVEEASLYQNEILEGKRKERVLDKQRKEK